MEDCTQVLDESFLENINVPDIGRIKVGSLSINEITYDIFRGENFIGRDELSDIVVQCNSVSSKHACIEVEDWDTHMLYDCGSTNKTRLGKVVLKPNVMYALQGGEAIMFADIKAKYTKFDKPNNEEDLDDSASETGSESMLNNDGANIDDKINEDNVSGSKSLLEMKDDSFDTTEQSVECSKSVNDFEKSSIYEERKNFGKTNNIEVIDDSTDDDEFFILPSQSTKEFSKNKQESKNQILTEDIFGPAAVESYNNINKQNKNISVSNANNIFELETQVEDVPMYYNGGLEDRETIIEVSNENENSQSIFSDTEMPQTHMMVNESQELDDSMSMFSDDTQKDNIDDQTVQNELNVKEVNERPDDVNIFDAETEIPSDALNTNGKIQNNGITQKHVEEVFQEHMMSTKSQELQDNTSLTCVTCDSDTQKVVIDQQKKQRELKAKKRHEQSNEVNILKAEIEILSVDLNTNNKKRNDGVTEVEEMSQEHAISNKSLELEYNTSIVDNDTQKVVIDGQTMKNELNIKERPDDVNIFDVETETPSIALNTNGEKQNDGITQEHVKDISQELMMSNKSQELEDNTSVFDNDTQKFVIDNQTMQNELNIKEVNEQPDAETEISSVDLNTNDKKENNVTLCVSNTETNFIGDPRTGLDKTSEHNEDIFGAEKEFYLSNNTTAVNSNAGDSVKETSASSNNTELEMSELALSSSFTQPNSVTESSECDKKVKQVIEQLPDTNIIGLKISKDSEKYELNSDKNQTVSEINKNSLENIDDSDNNSKSSEDFFNCLTQVNNNIIIGSPSQELENKHLANLCDKEDRHISSGANIIKEQISEESNVNKLKNSDSTVNLHNIADIPKLKKETRPKKNVSSNNEIENESLDADMFDCLTQVNGNCLRNNNQSHINGELICVYHEAETQINKEVGDISDTNSGFENETSMEKKNENSNIIDETETQPTSLKKKNDITKTCEVDKIEEIKTDCSAGRIGCYESANTEVNEHMKDCCNTDMKLIKTSIMSRSNEVLNNKHPLLNNIETKQLPQNILENTNNKEVSFSAEDTLININIQHKELVKTKENSSKANPLLQTIKTENIYFEDTQPNISLNYLFEQENVDPTENQPIQAIPVKISNLKNEDSDNTDIEDDVVQDVSPIKQNSIVSPKKLLNFEKNKNVEIDENSRESDSLLAAMPLDIDDINDINGKQLLAEEDKNKRTGNDLTGNKIETSFNLAKDKQNSSKINDIGIFIKSSSNMADMDICSTVGDNIYTSISNCESSKKVTSSVNKKSTGKYTLNNGKKLCDELITPIVEEGNTKDRGSRKLFHDNQQVSDDTGIEISFLNNPCYSSTPFKFDEIKTTKLNSDFDLKNNILRTPKRNKNSKRFIAESPILPSTEELLAVADKTPESVNLNIDKTSKDDLPLALKKTPRLKTCAKRIVQNSEILVKDDEQGCIRQLSKNTKQRQIGQNKFKTEIESITRDKYSEVYKKEQSLNLEEDFNFISIHNLGEGKQDNVDLPNKKINIESNYTTHNLKLKNSKNTKSGDNKINANQGNQTADSIDVALGLEKRKTRKCDSKKNTITEVLNPSPTKIRKHTFQVNSHTELKNNDIKKMKSTRRKPQTQGLELEEKIEVGNVSQKIMKSTRNTVEKSLSPQQNSVNAINSRKKKIDNECSGELESSTNSTELPKNIKVVLRKLSLEKGSLENGEDDKCTSEKIIGLKNNSRRKTKNNSIEVSEDTKSIKNKTHEVNLRKSNRRGISKNKERNIEIELNESIIETSILSSKLDMKKIKEKNYYEEQTKVSTKKNLSRLKSVENDTTSHTETTTKKIDEKLPENITTGRNSRRRKKPARFRDQSTDSKSSSGNSPSQKERNTESEGVEMDSKSDSISKTRQGHELNEDDATFTMPTKRKNYTKDTHKMANITNKRNCRRAKSSSTSLDVENRSKSPSQKEKENIKRKDVENYSKSDSISDTREGRELNEDHATFTIPSKRKNHADEINDIANITNKRNCRRAKTSSTSSDVENRSKSPSQKERNIKRKDVENYSKSDSISDTRQGQEMNEDHATFTIPSKRKNHADEINDIANITNKRNCRRAKTSSTSSDVENRSKSPSQKERNIKRKDVENNSKSDSISNTIQGQELIEEEASFTIPTKRKNHADDSTEIANISNKRNCRRGKSSSTSSDVENRSRSGSCSSRTSLQSENSTLLTPRRSVKRGELVLFTGLSNPALESGIKTLGGTVVECPKKCSVLVTDKVRRTVKFLCVLGQGKPIVTPDWILQSRRCCRFEDAKRYLLKDVETEDKFNFKLVETLQQAKTQPLLSNYHVYTTPSVKPPSEDIKNIVECCGGQFLSKTPSKWPDQSIVISHEEDRALWKKLKVKGSTPPIVAAEMLLLGVLQHKLNIETHRLS